MRRYFSVMMPLLMMLFVACTPVTPTATVASLVLDATYSGSNVLGGTAEIRYPASWFFSGEVDTGLQFATEEGMLQNRPENLTGDQIFGGIVVIPTQLAGSFSGNQPATPINIMQSFLTVFTSDDVTLSAATEITVGERNAAQITGNSPNGDLYFITVNGGDAFFIVFAATAQGALGRYQSTFMEIAARAIYTP
jgi:hypothetical protein